MHKLNIHKGTSMSRRILTGVLLSALLAGCGSNVKLNDVPVEDRTGTAVAPGGPGGGANTAPTTQSQVAPVVVDPTGGNQAGPANVARILYFEYDSYAIKPE